MRRSDSTPEYLRKANHVRSVMVLCIAVVFALCAVLACFATQYFKAKSLTLVSSSVAAEADIDEQKAEGPTQSVFAPNLVSLLGVSADDAVSDLGHGAIITDRQAVAGSADSSQTRLTVVLANEPADKLAGAPTVYLLVDDDQKVVEAGYQAGMRYLGYGSLSFTDAVDNAHVVESLLTEAGLPVAAGTVSAPEDKSSYAVLGSDKVTLVAEVCDFTGTSSVGDENYSWRATVSYDYSYANETGNLINTVRVLAVYVSRY